MNYYKDIRNFYYKVDGDNLYTWRDNWGTKTWVYISKIDVASVAYMMPASIEDVMLEML